MTAVPKFSGAPLELSDAEFIAALRATPAAMKAVTDKSAAVAARRKSLADELEKLEQDARERWGQKQVEQAAALQATRDAEAALQAARNAQFQLNARLTGESFAHDQRRNELEAELKESCSPLIGPFISWCRDEHAKARRAPLLTTHETKENPLTGKKVVASETNRASILARMDALRAAQAAAEDMRLLGDQTDVEQALADLKKSIPNIGA